MTLDERAALYAAAFPKYPTMWVDKDWLMGVWVLGNLYAKATGYYGAYPGNYMKRVLSMFPDRDRTLHLFSGTLVAQPGEVTLDCMASDLVQPTILGDARKMPFPADSFDFVMADPPYSAKDALNYGTGMPSRRHVMHEVRRVVQKGAHLCWLDTVRPMYSKEKWKQVGAVAVLVSTNTRTRCLSIFEAV
jgi:hypothetical protein